tara:strand:- start:922 stop:2433 length:1512 start_codon:yes stop_codon:yes gene_type:complete
LIQKIVGPPGTGKTTTLLTYLEELLNGGVKPEKIIFTSFTRAATEEARNRAHKKFGIQYRNMSYFRTLHSLCKSMIPITDVMSNKDWCNFAKKTGYGFGMMSSNSEEYPVSGKRGDQLRRLDSLHRLRIEPLGDTLKADYDNPNSDRSLTLVELTRFSEALTDFKLESELIDFTDMLEVWLSEGWIPPVSHVIIDEAQDFSKLQWAVIKKLTSKAETTVIAGDDDQALFEWNGASPENFINLEATQTNVLPRSYRIPARVHQLAMAVTTRIRNRIEKEFKPREEEGQVTLINNLISLPMQKGEWLLLARNNGGMKRYNVACRALGLPYTCRFPDHDPDAICAARTWLSLVKGQKVPTPDCRIMYKFFPIKTRVKYGFKKMLESTEKETLSMEELQQEFGLLPSLLSWEEQLNTIKADDMAYISQLIRNKTLHEEPRIHISTIHGAKGSEADNVVILTDIGPLVAESMKKHPDQEHRVWYVGFTRARERLFIHQPTTPHFYPIP